MDVWCVTKGGGVDDACDDGGGADMMMDGGMQMHDERDEQTLGLVSRIQTNNRSDGFSNRLDYLRRAMSDTAVLATSRRWAY